jgi:hypothetical protein
MSQNVTLSATISAAQSLAVEALASGSTVTEAEDRGRVRPRDAPFLPTRRLRKQVRHRKLDTPYGLSAEASPPNQR